MYHPGRYFIPKINTFPGGIYHPGKVSKYPSKNPLRDYIRMEIHPRRSVCIFTKFSRRYEIPSRGGVFYSKNHTYPVEIDFTKNHILAIFELHRNALPTQSGGEV